MTAAAYLKVALAVLVQDRPVGLDRPEHAAGERLFPAFGKGRPRPALIVIMPGPQERHQVIAHQPIVPRGVTL